ncbi:DUF4142 domain-containing protein [Streptomyces sp. AM 4-1-1]|uniref:DUF4142 domain-containing protein n=1 Tax=unclassified Streptomyces TaxID=2593676 RepID=UPI0023B9852F|nr:DUF4142 domain-containing protein [Streptomyces sp. AM 4-1-1]WEH36370.1 DUF4142 domain-containing protein [Streptomyces sp. AM 4-1-1]
MRTRLVSAAVMGIAMAGVPAPQAFAESVSDLDTSFVKSVHQGNLAEIAAGQDARKNGRSLCVKTIGEVLVRDHGMLDADLKTLAAKLDIPLSTTPTADQRRTLDDVRAKAGTDAYDSAWLTAQEAAHTKTLALLDDELRNGKNVEVKAAAGTARPVVAEHLAMVRGGTCHVAKDIGVVHAGSGGQFAAAAEGRDSGAAGTATLAGGGLLAAGGAAALLRGRRRPAGRR